MIESTEYNSQDALLLAAAEIEAEDDRLIELLTRLGRTFGNPTNYNQPEINNEQETKNFLARLCLARKARP